MRVRPVKTHKCQNSSFLLLDKPVWKGKLPIHQKYTRNTKLVLSTSVLQNFEQLLFLVLFGMKKWSLLWKGLDVMKISLKSWKFPKYYCFGKLNLTNRFGKEKLPIHQKYTQNTKLVLPKNILHNLSNFCFLCFLVWKSAFCYEKGAWCHGNLLEVMKVSKILLFW